MVSNKSLEAGDHEAATAQETLEEQRPVVFGCFGTFLLWRRRARKAEPENR